MATEYTKPLPEINDENRAFWEGCQRHELLLQQCTECGHMRHTGPACPECWSTGAKWTPASGNGVVYSWIEVHQRYNRAFEDDLPYNVAIVELDEGPRLVANVTGAGSHDIQPAMAVEVVWDDITEEVTLPRFAPT